MKYERKRAAQNLQIPTVNRLMASMLYYNGVDSVSIPKRLGHAQVSTTANIYAHVMQDADKKNAEILADVFLKRA